ncbi:MAG: hypothetical protein GJ680_06845 [Alteromonadaceae bacterium]|nr:hypothetical protein [Alteromonadaceae bacterium]
MSIIAMPKQEQIQAKLEECFTYTNLFIHPLIQKSVIDECRSWFEQLKENGNSNHQEIVNLWKRLHVSSNSSHALLAPVQFTFLPYSLRPKDVLVMDDLAQLNIEIENANRITRLIALKDINGNILLPKQYKGSVNFTVEPGVYLLISTNLKTKQERNTLEELIKKQSAQPLALLNAKLSNESYQTSTVAINLRTTTNLRFNTIDKLLYPYLQFDQFIRWTPDHPVQVLSAAKYFNQCFTFWSDGQPILRPVKGQDLVLEGNAGAIEFQSQYLSAVNAKIMGMFTPSGGENAGDLLGICHPQFAPENQIMVHEYYWGGASYAESFLNYIYFNSVTQQPEQVTVLIDTDFITEFEECLPFMPRTDTEWVTGTLLGYSLNEIFSSSFDADVHLLPQSQQHNARNLLAFLEASQYFSDANKMKTDEGVYYLLSIADFSELDGVALSFIEHETQRVMTSGFKETSKLDITEVRLSKANGKVSLTFGNR